MSEVSIWYLSNFQRCNFHCRYCVAHQPDLQRRSPNVPAWQISSERHERVLAWIMAQPYRVRLRMNSLGEPFVSKEYLNGVARLSHADNLSFVEVLTNGSFRKTQVDALAKSADLSKVSLWVTFHHPLISPLQLVAAASYAQSLGAFVVVHALLFPDNMDAVEKLLELCTTHGLRFSTGAGVNFNNAYPKYGSIPSLDNPSARAVRLVTLNNQIGTLSPLAQAPLGRPCSAGNSYFYITAHGEIFPCANYAATLGHTRLGSVLDEHFRLSPNTEAFTPCISERPCWCPEDLSHLKEAQQLYSWTLPTFGLGLSTTTQQR